MISRLAFLGISCVLLLTTTTALAESPLTSSVSAIGSGLPDSKSSFTPVTKMARLAAATSRGRKISIQGKNQFAGHWRLLLTKRSDSCNLGAPNIANLKINISNKLIGTDEMDGSPLFRGTVRSSNIYFGRARAINANCTFSQALGLIGVKGKSASGQVVSKISCNDGSSCLVAHAGYAKKL